MPAMTLAMTPAPQQMFLMIATPGTLTEMATTPEEPEGDTGPIAGVATSTPTTTPAKMPLTLLPHLPRPQLPNRLPNWVLYWGKPPCDSHLVQPGASGPHCRKNGMNPDKHQVGPIRHRWAKKTMWTVPGGWKLGWGMQDLEVHQDKLGVMNMYACQHGSHEDFHLSFMSFYSYFTTIIHCISIYSVLWTSTEGRGVFFT